ncbi:MAG: hypothetical protein RR314_04275 [Oscillospiraceae bacterium]
MKNDVVKGLISEYKNFVFIGEAGSGKTETALSLALAMVGQAERSVHFFDMDQTKPLFRARNAAGLLEREGIIFHFQSQYMDAPTVAPAVMETLMDERAHVLVDVGGGAQGAHMIGQFSHILNRPNTRVFYLINPYRPWSGSAENIAETMARVTGDSRLAGIHLVASPNLGAGTTAREVIEGEKRLRELCGGLPIDFISVLESLCAEVSAAVSEPVLPLRLNTLPDWM